MKLAYTAYDQAGKEVTATIDAANATDATDTLRRKGLYVSRIDQTAGEPGAAPAAGPPPASRRRTKNLRSVTGFMRQLYVLLSCSTPMVEALRALERQSRDESWQQIVADVRSRVEQGACLSAAMESHPDTFNSICRGLISAGESTGDLPAMLQWLADITQKELRIRSMMIGALVYPALLLSITLGVLATVMLVVVPRFGDLFKTLDMPLPGTTEALISISEWTQGYWWAVLGSLAAATIALRLYLTRPAGQRMWDSFVLRIPQVGRMARSFITARMARLLGGLMNGHVQVLEALDITQQSIRNTRYVELVARAREAVSQGESLSSAFNNTDLISPSVYEAMRNGEKSGQIAPLLLNLADFMDEENEIVVRSLTTIVEPVILVIMGLLVGTVALGMFMPLFDLTAMTQGGT